MTHDLKKTLLAVIGLCFVLVLVALDQTVVTTALPTIVSELNGFELYAWVGTAYLLTSVVTIPIMGRLGDDHGRKPLTIIAIIIFALASALCGVADTMLQLVLARAAQGIGGGMLVATGFACIPDLFPRAADRLKWQVFFSAAFAVATATGPSLGGFMAEFFGWRSVFYVNLPVSAIGLYCIYKFFPNVHHNKGKPAKLDYLGAALIALFLGSFQLFVEMLPQHRSNFLLTCLAIVAVASFILLIMWESRCENPILPLEMFTHSHLRPVFILSALTGLGIFGLMFFAPLLLEGGFGLTPKVVGLLITPLAVGTPIGTIVNSRIMPRLKYPNPALWFGCSLFLITTIVMSTATVDTPHWVIFIGMALGGFGMGFVWPNLTMISQAQASITQVGIVTAIGQSLRMVGSMIGTAIIGTIVTNLYASGVAGGLSGSELKWLRRLEDPQVLVNTDMTEQFISQAGGSAAHMIHTAQHSLVHAVHTGLLLLVACAVLMLVTLWWLPKTEIKGLKPEPATGH